MAASALAVLIGFDGSPGWRAFRLLLLAIATLALLAAFSSRPAWRAPLAAIAGIPAVAVAIGFAPHWAKGGPVRVQAAAAVLAAAGLILLIGGVTVATRRSRWWHRAGALLMAVVGTGLALLVISPAVAATNVPRSEITATPESVGLDYEDVTLRTSDGVSLAAWYVTSSNGAAVVLLHGAGSTRSDVLAQAGVLARAGFGVLLVDARGHGESAGRAMDFGWNGDADIAAAIDHLTTRPDVDPDRLGVVGMSMGGEEAIGASGSNRSIRAVVAEGATGRVAADDAWLSDHFGARGFLQEQLEQLQDRITDVLSSASIPTSCRSAVETSNASYLLITAGDEPDEGHFADHLAAGAPDRVQTWTIEGAAHTAGLKTAGATWEARVVEFLESALVR